MRAVQEWVWWALCAGMLVVGWWLSLFPTDLKSFSLLLKTSVTIPADPIGWLLLLAGWSVVLLAAAAMALFLFDRLSSSKARQQAGDPGA